MAIILFGILVMLKFNSQFKNISKNVYNLINICYNINVYILYENLLERRILHIFTIVKGGENLWLVKKERKKVDANQAKNLDN